MLSAFIHSSLRECINFCLSLGKPHLSSFIAGPFHTVQGIDFLASFHNTILPSCIALSFHTTRKNCSILIHSFGRGLILYLYIHTFLSRIPSIILHAFLIPNFRKFHSTIHSFLEAVISLYFSIVSSVVVQCSINPCFWERVDVACQFFFFHPALLCYSMLLGKNVIRPVSSFLKGLISVFFNGFPYHFSLLYQPMLLGGGGCCVSNFSFIVLHCSVIPYY